MEILVRVWVVRGGCIRKAECELGIGRRKKWAFRWGEREIKSRSGHDYMSGSGGRGLISLCVKCKSLYLLHKTAKRITWSDREVADVCLTFCIYSSTVCGRHWQFSTAFYQWGQLQAQNIFKWGSRQLVPEYINWHKLGTQEIISVITPKTHTMSDITG